MVKILTGTWSSYLTLVTASCSMARVSPGPALAPATTTNTDIQRSSIWGHQTCR